MKKLSEQMWEELKRLDEYCDLLEKMIIRGDAEELGKMKEFLLGEKAFVVSEKMGNLKK